MPSFASVTPSARNALNSEREYTIDVTVQTDAMLVWLHRNGIISHDPIEANARGEYTSNHQDSLNLHLAQERLFNVVPHGIVKASRDLYAPAGHADIDMVPGPETGSAYFRTFLPASGGQYYTHEVTFSDEQVPGIAGHLRAVLNGETPNSPAWADRLPATLDDLNAHFSRAIEGELNKYHQLNPNILKFRGQAASA